MMPLTTMGILSRWFLAEVSARSFDDDVAERRRNDRTHRRDRFVKAAATPAVVVVAAAVEMAVRKRDWERSCLIDWKEQMFD